MTYIVRVKLTGRKGSAHGYAWGVAWRMADMDGYPFSGVKATWMWQS